MMEIIKLKLNLIIKRVIKFNNIFFITHLPKKYLLKRIYIICDKYNLIKYIFLSNKHINAINIDKIDLSNEEKKITSIINEKWLYKYCLPNSVLNKELTPDIYDILITNLQSYNLNNGYTNFNDIKYISREEIIKNGKSRLDIQITD